MLTSGALVRVVAAATETPEPTAAQFMRSLREAGLITTGARGVNAARMTFLDASRFLIALVVTDRPTKAAQAVLDFGQLQIGDFIVDESVGHSGDERLERGALLETVIARILAGYADGSQEACNVQFTMDKLQVVLWAKEGGYVFHQAQLLEELKMLSAGVSVDEIAEAPEYGTFVEAMRRYSRKIKTTRSVYPPVLMEIADAFVDAEFPESRPEEI
jgi:hypothetical protein